LQNKRQKWPWDGERVVTKTLESVFHT